MSDTRYPFEQTATVTLTGADGAAAGSTQIKGYFGKIKTVAVSAGATNGTGLVASIKDSWNQQPVFSNTGSLATPVVDEVGLAITDAGGSAIAGAASRYYGSPNRALTCAGAAGNAGTLTFKILWEMTAEEYYRNFQRQP